MIEADDNDRRIACIMEVIHRNILNDNISLALDVAYKALHFAVKHKGNLPNDPRDLYEERPVKKH